MISSIRRSTTFKKVFILNTNIVFSQTYSKRNYSQRQNENVIALSYDLNDKFNSSKALVIAHGLFASKASWRALARRINEKTGHKIYTVDMRNHGESKPYVSNMNYLDMSNDLRHFIQTVVIGKDKCNYVTLMGHSMGGKTAMTCALTQSDGIDKLIVADISPTVSPSLVNVKSFIEKMSTIDMSSLAGLNVISARKQIDQRLCELEALKRDPNQRQFLLTRVVEINGKIDWHFNLPAIREHIDEIMQFPDFNGKQFQKPTLFIGGEYSEYITKKDEPAIAKYFTNYKIKTIPKAGHVIHFDNPTDTIQTINEFINN